MGLSEKKSCTKSGAYSLHGKSTDRKLAPFLFLILTCSSDVEDHSAQYWYAEQTIA